MQLYNKLSAKERTELIEKANKDRLTLSFYQYAKIGNPQEFRDQLFVAWNQLDVLGRIYVANEGINAQLSLPADRFNEFKTHLDTISFLKGIRLNIAIEQDNMSFLKLKVKVRRKIVADGLNDNTFDVTNKGIHVGANAFNELIEDENTVLLDMRNHYESEIGHFKNAVTPDVDTFRQVNDKGLENKCIGKNFVFDDRRAGKISDASIAQCHQCGNPFDVHTNCANDACHLLFIQCHACKEEMNNCCSTNCKDIHALPYKEQKALRKGQGNSNDIFKKGRANHLLFKKDLRNIFETLKVDKK